MQFQIQNRGFFSKFAAWNYYFLVCKKEKAGRLWRHELKIGDVRYDNMTKITIKVQLFWRLPYEMYNSTSKTNRLWGISDSKKVVG